MEEVSYETALKIVEHTEDQELLWSFKASGWQAIRAIVADRIVNQDKLWSMRHDVDSNVRFTVAHRIEGESRKIAMLTDDTNSGVRWAAIGGITDQEVLWRYHDYPQSMVRRVVAEKMDSADRLLSMLAKEYECDDFRDADVIRVLEERLSEIKEDTI